MTALALAVLVAQELPSGAEPRIEGVELRLPAGADRGLLDRLNDLVLVRKGQPLSRRAIRRSIETLYASGRFAQVTVRLRGEPLTVVFELDPRQTVRAVEVRGASGFSAGALAQATGLTPDSEYWPERGRAAVQSLQSWLRGRGYRHAEVSLQVEEEARGGVAVLLEVVPGEPTRLTSVVVEGAAGLERGQVERLVGLEPGDVLDLERVRAGLEGLREELRRRGYYRARLEPPQVEEDGTLRLPLFAGPRYRITFSGARSFSTVALRSVLGWDGEEPLDVNLEARLALKLERLYASRGFPQARVQVREVPPRGPERDLDFQVTEGPPLKVERLDFAGNVEVSAAELTEVLEQAVLASTPEVGLEVRAVDEPLQHAGRMAPVAAGELPRPAPRTVFLEEAYLEATRAMTALYRERGFASARVWLARLEVVGEQASARFEVVEGLRRRFGSVRVDGLPPEVRVNVDRLGQPFSESALEALRGQVETALGRQGYLYARVEAQADVQPAVAEVEARLQVEPGPQVRVRRVLAVGNERTGDAVLLAQSTLKEGQPLDREALLETQANLLALGIFRSAEVQMLAPQTPEPLKTVLLKVRERPRVSGELGVGYFLAEGPRLVVDFTAPNLGGLAINLSGHGQLNYFGLSAPVLFAQPGNTVFYRQDGTLRPPYELLGGRANLSLSNRGLLPGGIGVRLDAVTERVLRLQFAFTRLAAVPSLDWSTTFDLPAWPWARPKLTLQVQYELEWSDVAGVLATEGELSLQDQTRLRYAPGVYVLQTGRFSPTLDLRDDALAPRQGLLAQGSVELTGALSASDDQGRPVPVSFLKVSGLLTGYLPLGRSLVLALSARAGRIVPLGARSVTPPVKRFFLGGATTMRGFNEDQLVAEDTRAELRSQVADCTSLITRQGCSLASQTLAAGRQVPSQGGEFYAQLKAELRIRTVGALELALFLETGNLWLAFPETLRLRWVTGLGVRYVTPLGPLALDVGFNLTPDLRVNEPIVVPHFNIGVF